MKLVPVLRSLGKRLRSDMKEAVQIMSGKPGLSSRPRPTLNPKPNSKRFNPDAQELQILRPYAP